MLFLIYSLCGATWGLVFGLIGTQENGFILKELQKYPAHLRNQMKPLMIFFGILFEAVFWPVDAPVMIYKIVRKKI